jgi:drug/metabolite transporter (DMT)-like permease
MVRLGAALALLFASALWGIAFIFQKSAMSHVGPLTFVAARSVLAALALLPLARVESRMREKGLPRQFWGLAGCGGCIFFVAISLQQTGIATASVTNTGFLTALYVVLTPLLAWWWLGKAPSPAAWPAIVLASVGIWLLGGGTVSGFSNGDLLVAASAVFWAAHVVVTAQAAALRRPFTFVASQFAIVAALATPAAVTLERPNGAQIAAAAGAVVYVGLISSAVCFSILTITLQHLPPAEASVIGSMETVFATLAACLHLGERLTTLGWVGAGSILAATLLSQFPQKRATLAGES